MGLFAKEDIEEGDKFLEYCGVVKFKATWNQDKLKYLSEGIVSNYGASIGVSKLGPQDFVIDATRYGNLARFANHSHDPNCIVDGVRITCNKDSYLTVPTDIC